MHTLKWLWSFDTRFGELIVAVMILCRGLVLAGSGQAMNESTYGAHLAILSESTWAVMTVFGACMMLAGLVINGRWHRSPALRVAGALVGLTVYAMLSLTFLSLWTAPAMLAAFAYIPVAIACLWSAVNISSKATTNAVD